MADATQNGKGTRIAQFARSEKWMAISRVASMIAAAFLAPIACWVAYATWMSSRKISGHTATIATIKGTVDQMDLRQSSDGQKLNSLDVMAPVPSVKVEYGLQQIEKLWQRPAEKLENRPSP